MLALIGGLGPTELIIIFLIVLVLFGWNRLPQLGKGLGEGIRQFRSAVRDDSSRDRNGAGPDKGEPDDKG